MKRRGQEIYPASERLQRLSRVNAAKALRLIDERKV